MRRVRVVHRSKSFGRELRVAEFVRKELSDLIRRRMRDPRINAELISLTDVRVTRDLGVADVYLSCLTTQTAEERKKLIEVFESASGFLRSELALRHTMRTTPRLKFHYDDLLEQGTKMEALLDQAMELETEAEDTPSE